MTQLTMDKFGYPLPRRRKSRKIKKVDELLHETALNALDICNNNYCKAAERLGISRSTLYRYVSKRYNPTLG